MAETPKEIKLTLDTDAVLQAVLSVLTPASAAMVVERNRQVTEEGYDPEHDKGHAAELTAAGRCYADLAMYQLKYEPDPLVNIGEVLASVVPYHWPWAPEYWKPSTDPNVNLIKAGALLTAALDSRLAEES